MLYVQFLAKMLAIFTDVFHGFPLFFPGTYDTTITEYHIFSVYCSVILLYSTTLCSGEGVVRFYILYCIY